MGKETKEILKEILANTRLIVKHLKIDTSIAKEVKAEPKKNITKKIVTKKVKK
jgi:hypothetical protein